MDYDYDEPEEFDYSEASLAKMVMYSWAGRAAWHDGDLQGLYGGGTRIKGRLGRICATLLEYAQHFTSLGAVYYEAGLLGSTRYPGLMSSEIIDVARDVGIAGGKESKKNRDYGAKVQLPGYGLAAMKMSVHLEYDLVSHGDLMVNTIVVKEPQINWAFKVMALEAPFVQHAQWNMSPEEVAEEGVGIFGGNAYIRKRSSHELNYDSFEEAADTYMASPYLIADIPGFMYSGDLYEDIKDEPETMTIEGVFGILAVSTGMPSSLFRGILT